jgi:hypothetical protein
MRASRIAGGATKATREWRVVRGNQAVQEDTTMKTALIAFTAATAALALSAPPASAADACFRTNDMHNHTKIDDNSIYVAVGLHDVYRITAAGKCFAGMTSSGTLVIKTTASTGLVCKPLDLDLGVRDSGAGAITTHCIVSGVTKLTPTEVAAIPKKLKP